MIFLNQSGLSFRDPFVIIIIIIIIIIITIIIYSLEFFTSANADGFSLESEWQRVSSSLQDWRTWKLAVEWRPSKRHYWERPEYWEESWRLEETWWLSNSSERPSADADVKHSQRVK